MKEVDCPICGSRAAKALGTYCCLQCGWNVKRGLKMIRQFKYVPHVWMGITCLVFLTLIFEPGANSRLVVIVFCGVLAAIGLNFLSKLRRGRTLLSNHDGNISINTLEAAIARLQSEWEWLLKIYPPRDYQLSNKGRRNLIRSIFALLCINAISALTLAGNYWLLHRQHGPMAGKLLRPLVICNVAVLSVYTVLVCGLLFMYHTRARRLLAEGQAVLGRVVSFERSDPGSTLDIEFLHPLGKVAKARGGGPSCAYFEGMTMPVFFNPLKVNDSFVLLKDSDYEIIPQGLSGTSSLMP